MKDMSINDMLIKMGENHNENKEELKPLQELADSINTNHPNEMRKIKGGYEMSKYAYQITNTITEKGIHGKTIIGAKCLEDGIYVEITISNSDRNKRDIIKEKLNKEHDKLLKECDYNYSIQAGEIL